MPSFPTLIISHMSRPMSVYLRTWSELVFSCVARNRSFRPALTSTECIRNRRHSARKPYKSTLKSCQEERLAACPRLSAI